MNRHWKSCISALILTVFMTGCSQKVQEQKETSEKEIISGQFKVTCIDVGKGDCILAEYNGKTVMIDAGYLETAATVFEFLEQNQITHLDYFIITHYDKDHVGGAAAVAQNLSVDRIYLPDYNGNSEYYQDFMNVIARKNLNAEKVSSDISFSLDDAVFEIFASDVDYQMLSGEEGNDNDVSLVISAVYKEDSYLFAGDIEKDGIKSYLAKSHGQFDVVKMPHHGGKEKNSDDFIADVQPQIALITDSAIDLAHDKVLSLLAESQVETYRSSQCGTITVISTGNGNYEITQTK